MCINRNYYDLYVLSEGLVLALPTADFVTTAKPKRIIKAKVYKDCETTNIIERCLIKNSKGPQGPRLIQNNLNIHSSWKQSTTGTNCRVRVTLFTDQPMYRQLLIKFRNLDLYMRLPLITQFIITILLLIILKASRIQLDIHYQRRWIYQNKNIDLWKFTLKSFFSLIKTTNE